MKNKSDAKIKRKIEAINMIPNLVWSIIFLTPVCFFCYTSVNKQFISFSVLISLLTVFLPNRFFNKLQLSRRRLFYLKAGVMNINVFTQNGTLVRRFIRNKHPAYHPFPTNRTSAKKYFNQSYLYEKYHFMMFCLFLFLAGYSLASGMYLWVFVILFSNVLYNVYPILLQQYIRLRLGSAFQ